MLLTVAFCCMASELVVRLSNMSNKSRVDDAVLRLIAAVEKEIPDVNERVKGDVVNAKESKDIQGLLARVGEVDHIVFTAGEQLDMGKLGWPPKSELDDYKSI